MRARLESYLRTAILLIEKYNGGNPFHHYAKQYFSQHKKHGSNDRKQIIHLCYCYFRPGYSFTDIDKELRLKIAFFLCNDAANTWQVLYQQSWIDEWSNNHFKRIEFIKKLYPSFALQNIFPFNNELSETVETEAFAISHLLQPDLFLRIRPAKKTEVFSKLNKAGILFDKIGDDCLAFVNTTKIDSVLHLDNEAVVQDLSSQRIGEFLRCIKAELLEKDKIQVWDCCAASGGKSILACDVFENIQLTVSDIRPSIIHNLQQRFEEAGIKQYKSFVADLTNSYHSTINKYDLIICDAPCSGSGTWSRTPEQLIFFDKNKIEYYSQLQKQIVSNTISHLSYKAFFLFITCSVFEKENEEVANFIQNNFAVQLIKMELLKGYDKKADTMFAALFTNA